MKSVDTSPLKCILRYSLFLFLLLCVSSPGLLAQQPTSLSNQQTKPASDLETRQVDLTLQDQPLAAIIEALSDQIGHGIVVEGKPQVVRGSFKLQTSAKSALDQIAEYFDCTWTLGKHGAVLMSKRFRQPDDLPQLHLKEMQKMAADLLSIWPENISKVRMSTYPFTTVSIYPGNALFRTLTDEQLNALKSGNQLTFTNLTDAQKDLVRLSIIKGAAGNSHDIWEELNARLAKMPDSYLQWRSWFHNKLDAQPTPLQYSLEYVWPDLQDRGYERLVLAGTVNKTKEERK